MEIAELVLEFWKASIWPIAFLTAVMLFRDQIRDALKRAKTVDAMGVSVELAESAVEVQAALDRGQSTTPPAQDSEPATGPRPVSRATLEAAAKAYQRVAAILEQFPTNPPFNLETEGALFRTALIETAFWFGEPTWTDDLATRLAEETGNLNWVAFNEAGKRILQLPLTTETAIERRLVHRLILKALTQLADLLLAIPEHHPLKDS